MMCEACSDLHKAIKFIALRLDDMAQKLEDLKMSVDSIEVRLGKNPFTRDHFRKETNGDEADWRHIWAGDND